MMQLDRWLKTRQVAKALGVSDSTVKRWVDAGVLPAARTVGKHRLIRVSEALELARRQSLPSSGLELLAKLGETRALVFDGGSVDRLLEAFNEGDDEQIRALLFSHHAQWKSVSLSDRLIQPAMAQLGLDWQVGRIDICHEHRATRLVESALFELIRFAREREASSAGLAIPEKRPLAIGAAPDGTLSTIAGLLCELVLLDLGWRVINLGCNLPPASLARAVIEERPSLVWLSINHITHPETFIQEYQKFYESAKSVGAAVVVGGQALDADLRAKLVYTGFGDRMAHFQELARRLGASSDGSSPVAKDRSTSA